MTLLLFCTGVFTVALGLVHFFMPILFDFNSAIPAAGEPLRPFHLLFYTYNTTRSDVRGIAWVMNYAVSFTLITIGALDLLAARWIDHEWAGIIAGWIAAWWFVRAGSQLHLGRRRGDWLMMTWFGLLGAVHVWVLLRGGN